MRNPSPGLKAGSRRLPFWVGLGGVAAFLLVAAPLQAVSAGHLGWVEERYPNLVPVTPFYVTVGNQDQPDSMDTFLGLPHQHEGDADPVLRFTTSVANRGEVPLELFGQLTTDPGLWLARQCVRWASRACLERREVGAMVWHAEHLHWHFEDFVLHELRKITNEKTPDLSEQGLVSSSGKLSFCLQDSGSDTGLNPGNPPFYVGCTGVLQGISPGWRDIYTADLPGQSLPIHHAKDGRYALVHTVDPAQRLYESNSQDNISWALIDIFTDEQGERRATLVEEER